MSQKKNFCNSMCTCWPAQAHILVCKIMYHQQLSTISFNFDVTDGEPCNEGSRGEWSVSECWGVIAMGEECWEAVARRVEDNGALGSGGEW